MSRNIFPSTEIRTWLTRNFPADKTRYFGHTVLINGAPDYSVNIKQNTHSFW